MPDRQPTDRAVAPSRPQRKDAARNRELLIEAAREVFARRGIEASLDDVARHAGLGVGTAYRHFANKHELLSAIMAQSSTTSSPRSRRPLDIDDPWTALVAFFEAGLACRPATAACARCCSACMTPR